MDFLYKYNAKKIDLVFTFRIFHCNEAAENVTKRALLIDHTNAYVFRVII